jgi:hypothetical protein
LGEDYSRDDLHTDEGEQQDKEENIGRGIVRKDGRDSKDNEQQFFTKLVQPTAK